MGKLEIESKKRARKYAIQKGILTTLVVGGVIVLAGGSLAQALIKSVMSG